MMRLCNVMVKKDWGQPIHRQATANRETWGSYEYEDSGMICDKYFATKSKVIAYIPVYRNWLVKHDQKLLLGRISGP